MEHGVGPDKAVDLISSLLACLSDIETEHLTTFELNFLRLFAKNPPNKNRGAEEKILN